MMDTDPTPTSPTGRPMSPEEELQVIKEQLNTMANILGALQSTDPAAAARAAASATKTELENAFRILARDLRGEVKEAPAAIPATRSASWKPVTPEKFRGTSKEDPQDWFFSLECFFAVATDINTSRSRIAFAVSLLRDDALKWFRQVKSTSAAIEDDYEAFKRQFCHRFRTTDPVREARDQLAELKQLKSAKAYTSIFRTVALNIPDLSEAEALDRYLRGLKPHIKIQVMLHHPANLEDAMRLAETYDSMFFASTAKKPGKASFRPVAPAGDAMEIDAITRDGPIPKLTPELKAALVKAGKCFFCRNPGHTVKTCPKKAALASGKPKN
jgi:hypothetical protein